jgi:hypothetical protein
VVEHAPRGAVVQQTTDRAGAPPDHDEIVLALVRFLAGGGVDGSARRADRISIVCGIAAERTAIADGAIRPGDRSSADLAWTLIPVERPPAGGGLRRWTRFDSA